MRLQCFHHHQILNYQIFSNDREKLYEDTTHLPTLIPTNEPSIIPTDQPLQIRIPSPITPSPTEQLNTHLTTPNPTLEPTLESTLEVLNQLLILQRNQLQILPMILQKVTH